MNQPASEPFIDLLTETVDVHIDQIAARVEIVGPSRFQQHGAGHDLVGVPQQQLEQKELATLQVDHPTGPRHGATFRIDFQIADPKGRVPARAVGAAPQGLQSRQKLGKRIGFGEVVVASGLQPLDPVGRGRDAAQHQHRRAAIPLA